jgi:polar amino acid transport system permease protein
LVLVLFGAMLAVPALAQGAPVTIRTFNEQNYSVDGATIYVDGSFYGYTNTVGLLTADGFSPGNHTITATRSGYVNDTVTGIIEPGTAIRLVLVHDYAVVDKDAVTILVLQNTVARSTIAGADVYVDGVYLGTTDTVQGKTSGVISPGNHTITVAKTDDKTLKNTTTTLEVTPGQTFVVLMDMSGQKYSILDWDLFVKSLQKILTYGLENTIELSIVAFISGILIGLLMGIGRTSSNIVFRILSSVYVEGVRGLPLLLQLLFVNFGLPYLISNLTGTTFNIDIFTACVIALSVNSGAYMGEIFKAGIEAVHKGQTEAARSLGMTHNQALRFIILPQAFKIVLPALGNEFIALIKDSSIGLVISLPEIVYWAKAMGAQYYNSFTPILAAGIVYLLITIPLGKAVQYMEKKYNVNARSGNLPAKKKKLEMPPEAVV